MLPILRTISVGGVLLAISIFALAVSPPAGVRVPLASIDPPASGALIDRRQHPEWQQFLILAALRRVEEVDRLRDLPDTPVRLPEIPNITPNDVPGDLSFTFPITAPDPAAAQVGAAQVATPQVAGLPSAHKETNPDDDTGSINVGPDAAMSVEIGEQSSTELPLQPAEEKPPVKGIPSASAPAIDAPATMPSAAVEPSTPLPTSAPPQHAERIVVVIRKPAVHKHTVRRRTVRRAPPPKPSQAQPETPPPSNFFQSFFASFARKPEASASAVSQR